ncbi:MAG TPA: histidine kinase [Methylovirgula sp.]|nr:histidine kinase [Methylovirgula sp.]
MSLSLRARLNLLLCALLFLSLLLNISLIAWQAGPRIRAENQSDERLARHVISTVLASLKDAPDPGPRLQRLVADLQNLRHVRIYFAASEAQALSMPVINYSNSADRPPQWFVRLFAPSPRLSLLPVVLDGHNFGNLAIASDPTQELFEIWQEMGSVVATALLFGVCFLVLIMILVGRAIAPVAQVGQAITRLAAGDTAIKLVPHGPPEFIDISEKLNGLAVDLARVNAENTRLVRQIMKVQEEERAQIARDLHDEMGPHLFCIRANVSALSGKMPEVSYVGRTVAAIGEQAEAIQTLLRRLLQRLRPTALGELGLAEALRALVESWRAAHPELEISLEASDDFGGIDEDITLAAYRVIQEGLTNVFRHAGATTARVSVECIKSEGSLGSVLRAQVEDNGIGMPDGFERGLGLTGMGERVRACGGQLMIMPRATGKGTLVEAILPLARESVLETA